MAGSRSGSPMGGPMGMGSTGYGNYQGNAYNNQNMYGYGNPYSQPIYGNYYGQQPQQYMHQNRFGALGNQGMMGGQHFGNKMAEPIPLPVNPYHQMRDDFKQNRELFRAGNLSGQDLDNFKRQRVDFKQARNQRMMGRM